ncbi:hypothetical protein PS922_01485 [Pseudomonas fluorescens]|uniref:Uncharacterized protein n=1 Tax=Pseudomonas fluorescens TaxID=294 RepID=A0A5E7RU33_PSEFL|nr:hypothetical protein PS922_01485 [Pseudomonas fluorescens]
MIHHRHRLHQRVFQRVTVTLRVSSQRRSIRRWRLWVLGLPAVAECFYRCTYPFLRSRPFRVPPLCMDSFRPPSRASSLPQNSAVTHPSHSGRHKKGDPKVAFFALLPEFPSQATRYTLDVSIFPRPLRTNRPTPTIIPAVIGTLAIKGIGLVIKRIHPKLRIPMAIAPRWWREAGRSAWQRLGGFGRDGRLARYRRRRWRGARLRRRERWWCLMFRWLLDRTSA